MNPDQATMQFTKYPHVLLCLCLASLTFWHTPVLAQDDEVEEEPFTLDVAYDTPLTIDLEAEEEEPTVEPKKKKRKKKVFYGIKTKRGFVKTSRGRNVILEFFYYIKDFEEPDPYVRDIYWYSFKKKQIIKSRKIDKKYGVLLHGPYQKKLGDEQILEEGIFYKGMKHARWMRLDKKDILLDKEKYYKGWPRESLVAYWDDDRQKLKEIIPVEFGEREGYYYYFHENGRIGAMGEYKFGQKVGVWTEYYEGSRRRKRQIQYKNPETPFAKGFKPFVMKEWDERGRVIYDRKAELRSAGR